MTVKRPDSYQPGAPCTITQEEYYTLHERVAELEGANARMREACDHKHLNAVEKLATIATILTTV